MLLALAVLQGCSGYNSVLKSDDFEKKFQMANGLYDEKQYGRSIALFEQVYQRMPKTNQGEVSYYRIGKAYFTAGNYFMAGYYLSSFPEKFPASTKSEETTFLAALCSVKNSPAFSLDQNETELALNDLQLFINKYPESTLIDTCNVIMDKLRLKLERKAFESVNLYSKMENFKAASVSAENFIREYPRSVFREEAYYIMVKNSYLLAINSIESKKIERYEKTMERYLTFVAEFPSTSYKKEIETYYEKVSKDINNLTNTKK